MRMVPCCFNGKEDCMEKKEKDKPKQYFSDADNNDGKTWLFFIYERLTSAVTYYIYQIGAIIFAIGLAMVISGGFAGVVSWCNR